MTNKERYLRAQAEREELKAKRIERIKFSDKQGGMRQVQINGQMHVTVGRGNSSSMSVNGLSIKTEGDNLWVNGVKVDFDAQQDPAAAAASAARQAREQAEMKARYPGVRFIGEGSPDQIGSGVRIAPGAEIDLSSGAEITGNTVIGSTAKILGGKITGGRIDGEITGGVVNGNAFIAAGAEISGGVFNGGQVKTGARVSGGVFNGAVVGEKCSISGGVFNGTIIPAGKSVSGGVW